ncbi:hypothetical protein BDN71DRAFT_725398 [Pleurotus eryngii]|uniref:Uncharacterized protein n=1 Tax=Pleurotus eryngii TaxID=5323 RepID=A0A9P6A7Z3_PLEER|nr:hypothetical protein BDN71DRAFT_725398 [Pleurotus eryngii]
MFRSSHLLEALDIRDAELGELIASLPFSGDLHHPSVDAIWVREPAGQDWYSIPLRFCETWTDFAMVIYQHCRNGPEVEYLRQGNWAIVHVEDNHIIDQTNFTSILKSEMRFDIGVIVQLLSAALRTCPQCGHHNKGKATVDGWIRCSYVECNNLFRIIFNPLYESEPELSFQSVSQDGDNSMGISTSASDHTDLEDTSSKNGREHAEPLRTKFHRVLANVPHPPPEVINDPSPSSPHHVQPSHSGPPEMDSPYSTKPLPRMTMQIHLALGYTTTPHLNYDISCHPSTLTPAHSSLSPAILSEVATRPPLPSITLVSQYLPWKLEIKPTIRDFVTVSDVINGMYRALRAAVSKAEYAALPSLAARQQVTDAYSHRCARILDPSAKQVEMQKGLKRIDFFINKNRFIGLSSTSLGPHVWSINVL